MAGTVPCPICARLFAGTGSMLQHRLATHDNPEWVKSKKPQNAAPICPRCGNPAQCSPGKFGIRAECCGLWSWNMKPLVGKETHVARINAHDAFDRIWKSGEMSRGDAYHRLALAMGLTYAECHIALMTEAQAKRVVEIVRGGLLLKQAA